MGKIQQDKDGNLPKLIKSSPIKIPTGISDKKVDLKIFMVKQRPDKNQDVLKKEHKRDLPYEALPLIRSYSS